MQETNNQTSKWFKFGAFFGIASILAGLGLTLKWQHDILNKQNLLEKSVIESKDLGNGIIRSQSNYITKQDLDNQIKGLNLEPINKDLKDLHAEIKGIQILTSSTNGYHSNNLPSSSTEPRKDPQDTQNDIYGYLKNTQVLKLQEPINNQLVPLGEVKFKAWEEKPWDLEIYSKKYQVSTVISEDQNGRLITHNKFTLETQGKTYILPIQSNIQQVLPSNSFQFNPKIYLGVDVGSSFSINFYTSPNFSIFFFTYGKNKFNVDWSLLGLGLGYDVVNSIPQIFFSPVNYNIGHHILFMNNLFIGPSFGSSFDGKFTIGLGIRASL